MLGIGAYFPSSRVVSFPRSLAHPKAPLPTTRIRSYFSISFLSVTFPEPSTPRRSACAVPPTQKPRPLRCKIIVGRDKGVRVLGQSGFADLVGPCSLSVFLRFASLFQGPRNGAVFRFLVHCSVASTVTSHIPHTWPHPALAKLP